MLTNFKRRSALLITLAMVCASVSVVPLTAGAAASNVPNAGTSAGVDPHTAPAAPEIMKACPGDSAPAAGFTDTTSTDVDCIKMFGITTGKTATTYDPTGTISRQDMARYIHRMFTATGLAAAGTTAVPVFTDTAHVAADGLAAIAALASHGITLGTTATTFSPDDNVTRAQMATFLKRVGALVKDHAGGAITANATSGTYNYADIGTLTYEEMESVIILFNLGALGTCVVDALGKCDGTTGGTTYRPYDNITRAEMATMLTNLLNHTNARPAGVTIQASSAAPTVAIGTVSTLISVRGADHSASANVLVDMFHQLHNDTAGVAAQVPFHAVLGTCTATGGLLKTLGGTLCLVDASDPSTDVRGNAVGSPQDTAAYRTANWWVQTGASGSQFINGTTSTFDTLTVAFGAASTLANAVSTVISTGDTHAKALNLSAYPGITQADGVHTFAGQSRTFSVTMKPATLTHTVKPGYSIKVATSIADVAGNVTTSTAYYAATSAVGAATASFTTTCPADDSALTVTYATAIEHRISLGALLDADGLPAGVTVNPMDDDETFNKDATTFGTGTGGATAGVDTDGTDAATDTAGYVTVGMSCDDAPRLYVDNATDETLSVSSNNYASSAAGTLTSIVATAFDQYGAGVAGASVQIARRSTNTLNANTDTTTVATLTTSANGTASLSTVVCANGASVDAREAATAWSVINPSSGANQSMTAISTIAGTAPNAATVEGTIIYCTSPAADGVHEALTDAAQITTLTFDDAQADWTAGTLTCTVANSTAGTTATTAAMAFGLFVTKANDAGASFAEGSLEGLANMPAADIASTSSGAANQVLTIIWPAATGAWTVSCPVNTLNDDGVAVTLVIANGTPGVAATTLDFVDDDLATNTIVMKMGTVGASAAGAASTARTHYKTFVYDSGDVFSLDSGGDDVAASVTGTTEAAFEAENASLTALTTDMTVSYRTGALTSGISYFITGT